MKGAIFVLLAFICLTAANEVPPVPEEENEFSHTGFNEEVLGKDKLRELKSLSAEDLKVEIESMVERMDGDRDGRVSKDEMDLWLQKVQDNTYRKEGQFLFQKEDRNKDGVVTFNEYWMNEQGDDAPIHEDDMEVESNPTYAKFQAADINSDGNLDVAEFVPFVNPFRYEHMIQHLVDDQLLMYDTNKDSLVSLDEFISSFVQDESQHEELPAWIEDEKKDFKERLDKNSDNVLDKEEIREWVAPTEAAFRKEEVEHLYKHADLNQDGFLSVQEVKEEVDLFVNSPATDYGYTVHEEL